MENINLQDFVRAKKTLVTKAYYEAGAYVIVTEDGEEHHLDSDDISAAFGVYLYDEADTDALETDYATFCEVKGYEPLIPATTADSDDWDKWNDCPADEHPHAEEYAEWVEEEHAFFCNSTIDSNIETLFDEVVGKQVYGEPHLYWDIRTQALTTEYDRQADDDGEVLSVELLLQERTTEAYGETVEAAIRVSPGRFFVVTSKHLTDDCYPLSMWHICGDEAELVDSKKYIRNAPISLAYGMGTATSLDDAIEQLFDEMESIL